MPILPAFLFDVGHELHEDTEEGIEISIREFEPSTLISLDFFREFPIIFYRLGKRIFRVAEAQGLFDREPYLIDLSLTRARVG